MARRSFHGGWNHTNRQAVEVQKESKHNDFSHLTGTGRDFIKTAVDSMFTSSSENTATPSYPLFLRHCHLSFGFKSFVGFVSDTKFSLETSF
ncbi:hypothetical protein AVEN_232553-1 [Araneus ventricosus]|uniref:Uncharacterized protein n=1 Tax=Araneus ventricosus TaxID=182803 RepID=A0A4Y2KLU7_ARAVE|nr:hypothetical protein AVEN_232553-1 [Araneus ventricosus]